MSEKQSNAEPKNQKESTVLSDANIVRLPFWCRVGFHRWRTIKIGSVNIFYPVQPKYHDEQCLRCKIIKRLGHTMHGSAVINVWQNEADYKAY